MDRPIFLIGAARSGTTIIAETLAHHPDVAFWNEPKYVWRHGGHGARDDVRRPEEATPEVAAWIRERFAAYAHDARRPRFMEKTPTNCFRVGFMARVFPEGLFLHVLRNGRVVAASALNRWRSSPDDAAIARRLRKFEIPVSALHHYVPDILREGLMRRLVPKRGYVWGPRYPGLLEEFGHVDTATLCARQWLHSVNAATRELAQLPRERVLTFRYEDMVAAPTETLERICAFAGLPPSAEVARAAGAIKPDREGGWSRLEKAEQDAIAAVCDPLMRELDRIAPQSRVP
jgi:hypothetical protein